MGLIGEYGLFLAKTITVALAVLAILVGAAAAVRGRTREPGRIEVKDLNRRYDDMRLALDSFVQPKKEFKRTLKTAKQRSKDQKRGKKKTRKIFVLDFHGDIRASQVAHLRQEITAVLTVAQPEDEVVLRLESAGGFVHSYGLAASQLARLKENGIPLTAAIDKVAASGGYMLACVADRIIAAPFAVVGSIGVLSQLPNFHRWLKSRDIDFEQFTAGEHKRSVTLFGENTDADREQFQKEIEDTHVLFKEFIARHRKKLNVDRVATGEHWYGTRALELELVDELRTSDDYLLQASGQAALFEVRYVGRQPFARRLLPLGIRGGW